MRTKIRYQSATKAEVDHCVLCHSKTHYTKNISINKRVGYIEGVGQLCEMCNMKMNTRDKLF